MPLPPLYWRHLPVVAARCFPSHQPNPARASPEVQTCKKTGKWKKNIWKTKGRKLPPSPTSPTFKGLPLPLPLPLKPQVFASHFAITFITLKTRAASTGDGTETSGPWSTAQCPTKWWRSPDGNISESQGKCGRNDGIFFPLSDFSKALNQFLTYHTRDGSKNWWVHWLSIYVPTFSTYFV